MKFKVSDFKYEELHRLTEVLRAYGLAINCEYSSSGKTAAVDIGELPSDFEVKRKMTRGAGARSKGIRLPKDSTFNSETTCREFLEWLETHSAEEAMENLGLPRSTYFRRLRKIKEDVAWENAHNPARIASGREPVAHRLSDVK